MWKYFGKYITQQDVNKVISNTIVTYIVFIAALIVGYFITLTLSRKIIIRNSWWMLILAIPYIIFYWIITSKYSQFRSFVSSSNYQSNKVASMINNSQIPNIMLMNEFWYEIVTLIIIVLAIELGVIVFAFLQKKLTKRKRSAKSLYKYQTPKDVKESYIMPILLFLGIFFIVLSLVLDRSVTSNYQKKVMASAMKYNEELAIYNGDKNSKGTLTSDIRFLVKMVKL
ncbi:hypothetical protein GYW21_09305 [Lactobacillus mellis]|nr:hypothetical protein [Bombilactobacillus mellis]